MKFSTGIDIVEVSTIELQFLSVKFLNRVFSEKEISYCQQFENKSERFAARFAAKEAVMKALGTGWAKGVQWKQIEIENGTDGAPYLILNKKALEVFITSGYKNSTVSLSHCRGFAVASVIFYG